MGREGVRCSSRAQTGLKSMVFCCARITRGREDDVASVAVGPGSSVRGGLQAPGGRDPLPASPPSFIGTWWLWLGSPVDCCEDTTAHHPAAGIFICVAWLIYNCVSSTKEVRSRCWKGLSSAATDRTILAVHTTAASSGFVSEYSVC
jgi:hypothetical protein